MVQINFATREVNCKIVYYGPGRSGKTTNLEIVHAKAPKDSIGELISIATETDRTLYFDYLPLDLGQIAGMTTKFQLYTVPGQVFYNATRKLVLQGADGVIFVADSHPDMLQENIESLQNLEENLRENGLNIDELPMVIQYNKRDLENALPVEELDAAMNRWGAPHHEGVAVKGEGVFPTLKTISSLVIRKLNQEQGFTADGKQQAAPPPPPAAPPQQQPQPQQQPVAASAGSSSGGGGGARAPQRPAAQAQPARPGGQRTNALAQEIQKRKKREQEARRPESGRKPKPVKKSSAAPILFVLFLLVAIAVAVLWFVFMKGQQ
jgi:hypothetical protein